MMRHVSRPRLLVAALGLIGAVTLGNQARC